jgi:hypothetical protein
MAKVAHLSFEEISEYGNGTASVELTDQVDAHISDCTMCSMMVSAIRRQIAIGTLRGATHNVS